MHGLDDLVKFRGEHPSASAVKHAGEKQRANDVRHTIRQEVLHAHRVDLDAEDQVHEWREDEGHTR